MICGKGMMKIAKSKPKYNRYRLKWGEKEELRETIKKRKKIKHKEEWLIEIKEREKED